MVREHCHIGMQKPSAWYKFRKFAQSESMISLLLGVTFLFGVSQACLPMKPSSGPGLPGEFLSLFLLILIV